MGPFLLPTEALQTESVPCPVTAMVPAPQASTPDFSEACGAFLSLELPCVAHVLPQALPTFNAEEAKGEK